MKNFITQMKCLCLLCSALYKKRCTSTAPLSGVQLVCVKKCENNEKGKCSLFINNINHEQSYIFLTNQTLLQYLPVIKCNLNLYIWMFWLQKQEVWWQMQVESHWISRRGDILILTLALLLPTKSWCLLSWRLLGSVWMT